MQRTLGGYTESLDLGIASDATIDIRVESTHRNDMRTFSMNPVIRYAFVMVAR